jgi:ABC-2 type transport system ATP-binding protein
MSKALIVENLSKNISNQPILKNISFSVERGSFCAFIGPNGAGKTTTIRSIIGLFPYSQGKITILDQDAKNILSRMKVGYVIEKENFFNVSAKQFLCDMASYYDIKQEVVLQRIDELATLFNIKDKLDDRLDKMSSGQKKKIMIIQALVHDPDLIIMDEPTENLDPDTREIFYQLINKLKNQNKTIFISTHNLDEIEHYVDYIIILGSGEIKYTGK